MTWSMAQFFCAAEPKYCRWTSLHARKRPDDRERAVGREGVDDEDLVGERQALQAFAEVGLLVEGGDDRGERTGRDTLLQSPESPPEP